MNKYYYGIGIFFLLLPAVAEAAIRFSEIAWMGDQESASNEWIELHNFGQNSIALDGWTVQSTGGLEIDMTGTIGAGAYVVLERTDDDSAAGDAFLLYSGALANTGETLSLYDADGQLQNSVAGGDDWVNIGGDNTTKQTAQYDDGNWITATGTPQQALLMKKSEVATDTRSKTETIKVAKTNGSKNSGKEKVEKQPNAPLSVDIQIPKSIYEKRRHTFTALPSGLGKTVRNSLHYNWNFGDFATSSGRQVSHTFGQPGEYIVSVQAMYGQYLQTNEVTVTVLPVAVSLEQKESGDILLRNTSEHTIDISHYRLYGTQSFVIPERTYVVANGTISIAPERIRWRTGIPVFLYDSKGGLVSSVGVKKIGKSPETDNVAANISQTLPANDLTVPVAIDAPPVVATTAIESIVLSQPAQSFGSDAVPKNRYTMVAVGGILTGSLLGVWFSRRRV